MITSETVFILGAGASIPYGFPSGLKLRQEICAAANAGFGVSDTLRSCGIPAQETGRFATIFRDSQLASIDAFLSRRNEFVDIGKLAIAAVLCECENLNSFFASSNEDDWYFVLWNAMVTDAHQPDDLLSNKIQIVTFNYDRSLEYYLFFAIMNTFGVTELQASEILKRIPIRHVYGQLGEFALYSGQLNYYKVATDADTVRSAANGIRIIPEDRDNSDEIFLEVKEWFRNANNICFLGFGFDRLNMNRLRLSQLLEEKVSSGNMYLPTIYTSSFGKTHSELKIIQKMIHKSIAFGWAAGNNDKSLMTLRNNVHLLT